MINKTIKEELENPIVQNSDHPNCPKCNNDRCHF